MAIVSCLVGIDPSDKSIMKEAIGHARALMPENVSFRSMMMLSKIPQFIRFNLGITITPNKTQKYFKRVFESIFNQQTKNRTFSSQMMANEIPDSKKETATKGFTRREIIANSILVIIAGHETT